MVIAQASLSMNTVQDGLSLKSLLPYFLSAGLQVRATVPSIVSSVIFQMDCFEGEGTSRESHGSFLSHFYKNVVIKIIYIPLHTKWQNMKENNLLHRKQKMKNFPNIQLLYILQNSMGKHYFFNSIYTIQTCLFCFIIQCNVNTFINTK